MSENFEVKQTLNSISEEVVFLDVDEKKGLGKVLNGVENIIKWAKNNNLQKTEEAFRSLVSILELLILDEAENPEADFELIESTISELQKIVENNYSDEEVEYPAKLLTGKSTTGEENIIDDDLISDFIAKQKIELEEFEEIVINYEKKQDHVYIDDLKRKLHNLKGESAITGFKDIEKLCHATEDWLEQNPKVNGDILILIIDWLKNKINVLGGKDIDFDSVDVIIDTLESTGIDQSADDNNAKKYITPEHLPENVDEDIFSDFLTKQVSVMENLEAHIMKLDGDDREHAFSEVKRILHTLKGESNLMGLKKISDICHESETYISENENISDFLFLLKDWIADTINYYIGERDSLPDDDKINSVLTGKANQKGLVSEELSTAEPEPIDDPELVVDFISEAEEHLEMANNEMLAFEDSRDLEKVNGIFRAFHTIKGVAGFLNLQDIRVLSHKTEDLLDRIRKQKIEISDEITDVIYQSIDKLKELIGALSVSAQKGVKPPPDPGMGEFMEKITAVLPEEERTGTVKKVATAAPVETRPAIPTEQKKGIPQKGVKIKENIKVDATRLDHLIDFIGELAIAESMLTQSPELRDAASAELIKRMNRLDKITRELQSTSMSLRMVTVKSTFQKMARLVRDLSKKSGKMVEFTLVGEDTELDKNVVEQIGDPLVHLIRNAVDHGIESSAEDRVKNGKSKSGHIQLSAFHKGGNIYIEVQDDGKGLDKDAIIKKALEKEIISPGFNLKDNEIFNLIFEPGFSTAKKVTDVSGRGVGMDVVRKNIEAMRGHVNIKSEKGVGTTFTIILPLTLAIIDGMVIKIGPERYIIPTLSVITSIKPEKKDYFTATGKGEMIKFQKNLIPLFRLSEYFNIDTEVKTIEEGIVVLVETGLKKLGIVVDQLLGQQQIVIKSLKGDMKDIRGISGGAIMPDGTVALILDIGGLLDISLHKSTELEETNEFNN